MTDSFVADEKLYYRGVEAGKLAKTATLEETATLLWGCDGDDPFANSAREPLPKSVLALLRSHEVDPITRTLAALPLIAAEDLGKYNMTPLGRWQLGARVLRAVAALIVGQPYDGTPLHEFAATAWVPGNASAQDLLRQALVLSAEHELNVSSFTVRCAISSGATLYHSIIAGLCALTGPKHGGATLGMNALLDELDQARSPRDLVQRRLESGQSFRGFNHPLYPNGDPRARQLINAIKDDHKKDPFVKKVLELLSIIESAAGAYPTIDFGLSLVARLFALPEHAGISIFALGRAAGWIAHAQEQERMASLIRPRARYVGQAPREKL
jgi:citrate synthase